MSNNLVNKVGECGQDNLIARLYPQALTAADKDTRRKYNIVCTNMMKE